MKNTGRTRRRQSELAGECGIPWVNTRRAEPTEPGRRAGRWVHSSVYDTASAVRRDTRKSANSVWKQTLNQSRAGPEDEELPEMGNWTGNCAHQPSLLSQI